MLREITTEGFDSVQPARELGPASQMQWIEIVHLRVDPSYQRDIVGAGRRSIRAIAENFRWSHFAPAIVAPVEGGVFAVVDGQHRVTGAAIAGIKSVPCLVILADREEQAKAFKAVNTQTTRIHSTAIFRAAVAAGDPEALAAVAMAKAADVTIATRPMSLQDMKARHTMAGKLLAGMAQQNATVGTLALRCCAVNSEDHTNVLRYAIIKAVFECLVDHQEWCRREAELLAIFEEIALEEQLAEASARAAKMRGTTPSDQLYVFLVGTIEKTLARRTAA